MRLHLYCSSTIHRLKLATADNVSETLYIVSAKSISFCMPVQWRILAAYGQLNYIILNQQILSLQKKVTDHNRIQFASFNKNLRVLHKMLFKRHDYMIRHDLFYKYFEIISKLSGYPRRMNLLKISYSHLRVH